MFSKFSFIRRGREGFVTEAKEYPVNDIKPNSALIQSISFLENDGDRLKDKEYELTSGADALKDILGFLGQVKSNRIEKKDWKIKLFLGEKEGPGNYPDDAKPLDSLDLRNRSDGGKGPVSKTTRVREQDIIKPIQKMLKALDYNIGRTDVDGRFGDNTERAVKEFQIGHKGFDGRPLTDDGMVGPRTADAMNRAVVGMWFPKYMTPPDLTKASARTVADLIIITIEASELQNGLDIKDDIKEAIDSVQDKKVKIQINVTYTRPKIVRGDFCVLTKKGINANADFQGTDKIHVTDRNGNVHEISQKDGRVFISKEVIVIGRFPDGKYGDVAGDPNNTIGPAGVTRGIPTGNATLEVVGKSDKIDVRIVDPPPFKLKTEIKFSDTNEFYHIGILANPAVKPEAGNIVEDPIMKKRSDFHHKVIKILETILLRSEDLLNQPDILPHLRVFALFDDSLVGQKGDEIALIQRWGGGADLIGPRSWVVSDINTKFLDPYKETVDVLALVSSDNTYRRASASFTIDDASDVANFTYNGVQYGHGKNVQHSGAFTSTIYNYYGDDGDKLTDFHEFCHAMSEKDKHRIVDLYEDAYLASTDNFIYINKKQKQSVDGAGNPVVDGAGNFVGLDHVHGSHIPLQFAKYKYKNEAEKDYESDKPAAPYIGRGGLGYPGTLNIRTTYGPKLKNTQNPNVMDAFVARPNILRSRLDELTYDYASGRIKAKIR